MLVEFSVVPLGAGSSIGEYIAKVLRIVHSSGLPYKITPMGTVIEGEWEDLFKIIRKCHMIVLKNEERVLTQISIDDRKGMDKRLEKKVQSIEKRLGMKLSK